MSGVKPRQSFKQLWDQSTAKQPMVNERQPFGPTIKAQNSQPSALQLLDELSSSKAEKQSIDQFSSEPKVNDRDQKILAMFGRLPNREASSSQNPKVKENEKTKQEKIDMLFGISREDHPMQDDLSLGTGRQVDERRQKIARLFGLEDPRNSHEMSYREKEAAFLSSEQFEPILLGYSIDVTSALLETKNVREMINAELPITPDQFKLMMTAAEDIKSHFDRGVSATTAISQANKTLNEAVNFENFDQVKKLVSSLEQHDDFFGVRGELTAGLGEGQPHDLKEEVGRYDRLIDNLNKAVDDKSNGLEPHQRELLKAMKDHVRIGGRGKLKTLLVEEMSKKLSHFKQAGANEKRSLSLSLGVGASVMGEGVANTNLKFGAAFTISTGDDDRIRKGRSKSVSLSLTLGNSKLIALEGSVGISSAEGKTFRTFDKFVEHEVEKALDSKIGKEVFNEGYLSHRKLEEGLRRHGYLNNPVQVTLAHRPVVPHVETNKVTKAGNLNLALYQAFKGEVDYTKTTTTFTKEMALVNAVKQNPNLLGGNLDKVHFVFEGNEVRGDQVQDIEQKILNLRKDSNMSELRMMGRSLET